MSLTTSPWEPLVLCYINDPLTTAPLLQFIAQQWVILTPWEPLLGEEGEPNSHHYFKEKLRLE